MTQAQPLIQTLPMTLGAPMSDDPSNPTAIEIPLQIELPNGQTLFAAVALGGLPFDGQRQIAERIAAAWNAFTGVPTEEIKAPVKCLNQIAEPSVNLASELADMLERSITGLGHYRNTERWSEADEEHIKECNTLLERFNSSDDEHEAAPQAVQPVVPLPLLVRDIARDLGITVPEACIALKPLGYYSTNSAVTAEMATKLREAFPNPATQAVQAAVPETREALAQRLIGDVKAADAIATTACRRVAELPDRDSPADWPEAMLVTGDELHMIVREAVIAAQDTPAHPAEGVPAAIDPNECGQDVFNNGVSVGLFDIPKDTANAICVGISEATGVRLDWHYIAGRVHIKVLAATQPAPQPVATITGLDEFGPLLGWHEHWAKFPVGTNFYTQPAAQGMDAQMLNFINDKRVALTPEYDGPWKAEVFADEAEPVITSEGNTVRDAVSAAIAAQAKQGVLTMAKNSKPVDAQGWCRPNPDGPEHYFADAYPACGWKLPVKTNESGHCIECERAAQAAKQGEPHGQ